MNKSIIKYVTCCKLWNEFHKIDNTSLLLRYKLTDIVYYKLLQSFCLINIRFNNFNSKKELTEKDIEMIEGEVIKFNDFFDIMSIINNTMNNNDN